MTSFIGETAQDRLWAADARREGLTLTAQEVADMIDDLPDEDDVMDRWIEALSKVDVKTLKVPAQARQAIASALGMDVDDLGALWA